MGSISKVLVVLVALLLGVLIGRQLATPSSDSSASTSSDPSDSQMQNGNREALEKSKGSGVERLGSAEAASGFMKHADEARKARLNQSAEDVELIKRLQEDRASLKEALDAVTENRDQPSHPGRITNGDNQANVFVISLGKEDGVKSGYRYIVARGNDFVGTIQIDDVQSKKSSGYVIRDLTKGQPQVGDSVFNAN